MLLHLNQSSSDTLCNTTTTTNDNTNNNNNNLASHVPSFIWSKIKSLLKLLTAINECFELAVLLLLIVNDDKE